MKETIKETMNMRLMINLSISMCLLLVLLTIPILHFKFFIISYKIICYFNISMLLFDLHKICNS